MITFKEILGNHTIAEVPHSHQLNIDDLVKAMNLVRDKWAKPMVVTSGYRSMQDHLRIYSQLAAQRGQTFDPNKVPMKSRHLSGNAVDISDPDGSLYKWCQDNAHWLESIGLWLEEKDDQKRVHFQNIPYPSWVPGKSIFFKA